MSGGMLIRFVVTRSGTSYNVGYIVRNESSLTLSRSAASCRSMIMEIIVGRCRVSSCRHSRIKMKKIKNNNFNGKYNEPIVITQWETVARNRPLVNYYIQVKYFLTVLFSLLFKTTLVKPLKKWDFFFFSSLCLHSLFLHNLQPNGRLVMYWDGRIFRVRNTC